MSCNVLIGWRRNCGHGHRIIAARRGPAATPTAGGWKPHGQAAGRWESRFCTGCTGLHHGDRWSARVGCTACRRVCCTGSHGLHGGLHGFGTGCMHGLHGFSSKRPPPVASAASRRARLTFTPPKIQISAPLRVHRVAESGDKQRLPSTFSLRSNVVVMNCCCFTKTQPPGSGTHTDGPGGHNTKAVRDTPQPRRGTHTTHGYCLTLRRKKYG